MSSKRLATTLGFLILVASPVVHAQSGKTWRGGHWEYGIQAAYTGSESTDGANGEGVSFDSDLGLGLSFGYNFSNHLAVRFEGTWLSPDYDARLVGEDGDIIQINHKADIWQGNFQGVYNVLEGPFTPFLQAGVGWTYIDSNIADGPPTTGCWWDPWLGYICAPFYSTYSDTNFSYSVGIGARYEFGQNMFIRGSADRTWLDGVGSGSTPTFDVIRLELGWQIW